MSAVSIYLEEEGIATSVVSLVREHSEVMQAPRALWVPFMLGRPMGAPNQPEFQRRVLREVLALFNEPKGPVLRDFADDAPNSVDDPAVGEGDACPVNFSKPAPTGDGPQALAHALGLEIEQLKPWHDIAIRKRGASGFGLSGMSLEDAAACLISMLSGTAPKTDVDRPPGTVLKQICDDLRCFYEEAATGQPGSLSAAALAQWYYQQTVLGEVLHRVRTLVLKSEDAGLRFVGERVMIPKAFQ